jgi:hypothetical protein
MENPNPDSEFCDGGSKQPRIQLGFFLGSPKLILSPSRMRPELFRVKLNDDIALLTEALWKRSTVCVIGGSKRVPFNQ